MGFVTAASLIVSGGFTLRRSLLMLVGNKGWGDERNGDYNDGDDDEDCSPPVLLEEMVLFVGAAVGVEERKEGNTSEREVGVLLLALVRKATGANTPSWTRYLRYLKYQRDSIIGLRNTRGNLLAFDDWAFGPSAR